MNQLLEGVIIIVLYGLIFLPVLTYIQNKVRKMNRNKLKIDPKQVLYDGRSFKLIIENEEELIKYIKQKMKEYD